MYNINLNSRKTEELKREVAGKYNSKIQNNNHIETNLFLDSLVCQLLSRMMCQTVVEN